MRFDKLGLSSEPHCCLLGSHYFLAATSCKQTFIVLLFSDGFVTWWN